MKTIPLSRGLHALVDDEDYEYLSKFKWMAWKNHKKEEFYAIRHVPGGRGLGMVYMHREIMGAAKGQQIDHIELNSTLDNRKSNLRVATHSQNLWHQKKHRNGTSTYKGVYWSKVGKKWCVRIQKDKVPYYLGYFVSERDAALAYDGAARKLFGQFAVLNFKTEEAA